MIAEELINQMIPPLKRTDKVSTAIHWMDELRVKQLPVIDKNNYIGLVSVDAIYQNNYERMTIGDMELICSEVFVTFNQHFYDILRIASSHDIQVISVLDDRRRFLGVVTLNDIMLAFAESTSMQEAGGILILQVEGRDYSLTEISRLVESNNAKVLSTHVAQNKDDQGKLQVTLKINEQDLNRIAATFERFNYEVVAKFHANDKEELHKERIDLLFKYLDI